jgi:hypothetical protein
VKGTGLSDIYYPLPPSFQSIGIAVLDKGRAANAVALKQGSADEGCTYDLELYNGSPHRESVRLTFDNAAQLPAGKSIMLVNPQTGVWEALGRVSTIEIPATGFQYRTLVVGSADYLAKAQSGFHLFNLALEGVFPNPFRNALTIRYTLPYAGIDRVEFSLFDIAGRMVWQRNIAVNAAYGPREVRWSGGRQRASGVLILRMSAFDQNGKKVKAFQQRLTHMP